MKFHVTAREKLAICILLVPRPTANLEAGHIRMNAWDELGVKDLAFQVADMQMMGSNDIQAAPYRDNRTPILVDITPMTIDFLLKGFEGEVPGHFSEVIRPLQDRLISLRDKTYKLPPELRPAKAAKADEPAAE